MSSSSVPHQAAILSNPGIASDVANDLQNGSLSYSADLSILEDAAVGGMTASKFSTLQTFASELNTTGGISVSPYVQQITDDVIFGNSANATWNGGAATATALGNLTANSTQTQADKLIGEWFLGTNLPSLSLAAVGQANLNPVYRTSTLPLYGPSGAPKYQDVNQGYVGRLLFRLVARGGRAPEPFGDREHDLEQRKRDLQRPLLRPWPAGLRDGQYPTADDDRLPMGERLASSNSPTGTPTTGLRSSRRPMPSSTRRRTRRTAWR